MRGRILSRLLSNLPFQSYRLDLEASEGLRLDEFGVPATILHSPGHTAGSISVIMDSISPTISRWRWKASIGCCKFHPAGCSWGTAGPWLMQQLYVGERPGRAWETHAMQRTHDRIERRGPFTVASR